MRFSDPAFRILGEQIADGRHAPATLIAALGDISTDSAALADPAAAQLVQAACAARIARLRRTVVARDVPGVGEAIGRACISRDPAVVALGAQLALILGTSAAPALLARLVGLASDALSPSQPSVQRAS